MKNYKLLIPIALVVLFAFSVFMAYDSNGKIENNYNDYLQAARSYAEQGIAVDAFKNYTEAIKIRDSFDLKMEIAYVYSDLSEQRSAMAWGEDIVKSYPHNAEGYEYLMNLYVQNEDYIACFKLADVIKKRNILSESISKILENINYTYFLKGTYNDVFAFSNGYCAVKRGDMYGFVNEAGELNIDTEFLDVGFFAKDLVPVVDGESQVYFIDIKGNKKKVLLDIPDIRKIGSYDGEAFTVFNGETWKIYKETDKESTLIAEGFEDISAISSGVVAAKKDGLWALFDTNGETLSANKYADIVMDDNGIVYRNERLFVKEGESYYLIDKSGNKINNEAYEEAKLFNDNTYAAVKVNGKWGFIDMNGDYYIEPSYQNARSFSKGLAAVMNDDKWGFINDSNALVLGNIFYDAKDFNGHGCVFVYIEGKWQLLKLYKYNH